MKGIVDDLGCFKVITFSAVGSANPERAGVGDIVIVRDFDTISERPFTRIDGKSEYVGAENPVSKMMSKGLYETARKNNITVHDNGIYYSFPSPIFETKRL